MYEVSDNENDSKLAITQKNIQRCMFKMFQPDRRVCQLDYKLFEGASAPTCYDQGPDFDDLKILWKLSIKWLKKSIKIKNKMS